MTFNHINIDLKYDDLVSHTGESGRVYYTPDGKVYPSITTVLGHRDKDSLNEWKKRVGEQEAARVGRFAANRGTIVHDTMERYIKGEDIDVKDLMTIYRPSYLKLKKVVDERLTDVYAQEQALYSHHLKVAGKTDLIGRFDGVRSVVDFKTSKKVKKKEWISNYFIQETAYSIMWEERTGMAVPNLVIIMDVDGHQPIVFKEHRDNWVKPLFEAINEHYRLQGENNC